MNINIKTIHSEQASVLCADIIKELPEWFGQPECSERYIKGVGAKNRLCFCAELPNGDQGV